VTGKDLVKLLEQNGWICIRIKGSHWIFEKAGVKVSVPNHGLKEVPTGTARNILKQAGLR
jgi:predicted RNA binding protein YcfA (HicA-like mRNA interferase family)